MEAGLLRNLVVRGSLYDQSYHMPKSFLGYARETVANFLNNASTKKIPYWEDPRIILYDNMGIFGKLDSRSQTCIFVEYSKTNNLTLFIYKPSENKVFVVHHDEFSFLTKTTIEEKVIFGFIQTNLILGFIQTNLQVVVVGFVNIPKFFGMYNDFIVNTNQNRKRIEKNKEIDAEANHDDRLSKRLSDLPQKSNPMVEIPKIRLEISPNSDPENPKFDPGLTPKSDSAFGQVRLLSPTE
ncbi:LOW QUALITY PROTEIN: hypothetical protein OSB04_016494 [Centaurea solstitialis]|uniref:Uncharacterized protein n=1 Tax=Centaurea solstitialis TaxID=347529 RepID=A0AA38T117_9ASTR|nr:LOW QUALITY PROTEIN: hypothetical protein OSB04_016494 [Centaurea solstitialis]